MQISHQEQFWGGNKARFFDAFITAAILSTILGIMVVVSRHIQDAACEECSRTRFSATGEVIAGMKTVRVVCKVGPSVLVRLQYGRIAEVYP